MTMYSVQKLCTFCKYIVFNVDTLYMYITVGKNTCSGYIEHKCLHNVQKNENKKFVSTCISYFHVPGR